MTHINMDYFYDHAMALIDKVRDTQSENIRKASEIFANSIAQDGVVQIFGSGHSVGFAAECTGRAGSLLPFHMIESSDFVVKGMTTLADFKDQTNIFERRPGIADKLYDLHDIKPQDAFIVISNSGINGLVIDLALTAKAKGHKVIVITSMEHTLAEPSRHPSGKKLYELADVVIDNCGPRGDALLETGDGPEKICSLSSITGIYIAQSLTIEITRILDEKGVEAPLLYSSEVKGYQEHNQALYKKYKGRI
ncbi:MAG: SIS domain-containing protein [Erysipelotrichaceae bacterium]|jgi:uncharacterized phosphosugar-binding protein|nr:SIS domain-containing protein [Erysipelotrichaceae bacterium]